MKRLLLLLALLLASGAFAADIKLPKVKFAKNKSLYECLQLRKSSRNFDPARDLSMQQLSNVLWAAYGFNRPGKRTAPSSRNIQEFEIYVFLKSGIYLYDAKTNQLLQKSTADKRAVTGKQAFVKNASVNLVFVADTSKMTGAKSKQICPLLDSGYIAQNIYLYCAGAGLGTVVRGWIDRKQIAKTLRLPGHKEATLAQSVGFVK